MEKRLGFAEVARIENIGVVTKCRSGIVHVNVMGISLHFTEDDFAGFASLVNRASSRLMDAGLSKLTRRSN